MLEMMPRAEKYIHPDSNPECFSQNNSAIITNTCMKLTLIIGSLFPPRNKHKNDDCDFLSHDSDFFLRILSLQSSYQERLTFFSEMS